VCELAVLNRADGSAKWTQENTSVVAAVYGPRQAMQRKEDAEQAVVEVVFKPRSGIQGALCMGAMLGAWGAHAARMGMAHHAP
jgi:ribonuclease PH